MTRTYTFDPATLIFSILTVIALCTGHLSTAIVFVLCAATISFEIGFSRNEINWTIGGKS